VTITGFEDFSKGGLEPITLSEEKLWSIGRKWVYIFNRQKSKKLIPVGIHCRGRGSSRGCLGAEPVWRGDVDDRAALATKAYVGKSAAQQQQEQINKTNPQAPPKF